MLYQKVRPTDLSGVLGNHHVVSTIGKMLEKNKLPHTILFTGPSGCGKTTLARVLAKNLNADVRELNSADFNGVDTVRDLIESSKYRPLEGGVAVYIIDECHKLTTAAQDAALKLLEDTPKYLYFFLCTTNPGELKDTFRKRCTPFTLTSFNNLTMLKLLIRTLRAEKSDLSKEVLDTIVDCAEGSPRLALVLLEVALSAPPGEEVRSVQNEANKSVGIELSRALVKGANWRDVSKVLQGLTKENPESVRRGVLGYCAKILLNKQDHSIMGIMEEFKEPLFNTGFAGLVAMSYAVVFNK